MKEAPKRIGVISDTHGLLRPEAQAALQGCDVILHAGDVGTPEVLTQLRAIAPVHAVRGNVDHRAPLSALPFTEYLEFGPQPCTCSISVRKSTSTPQQRA